MCLGVGARRERVDEEMLDASEAFIPGESRSSVGETRNSW